MTVILVEVVESVVLGAVMRGVSGRGAGWVRRPGSPRAPGGSGSARWTSGFSPWRFRARLSWYELVGSQDSGPTNQHLAR